MKKMAYLLSLTLIASLSFFSCDNAEDNEAPTVTNLKVNGVAVSDAVTVKAGEVTITFDLSDNTEIKNYTVLAGSTSIASKEVGADKISVTVTYNLVSSVIITINVTDDDDKTATRTFNLNRDANIKSFTPVLMGASGNTNGSLFSSLSGSVIKLINGSDSSANVDIVYYYGASNLATLGAPSNSDVQSVYGSIKDWGTKNQTSFKLTALTAAQFDAKTTDTDLAEAYTNVAGSGDTQVTKLDVGSVVAFKSKEKYGLAKVTALDKSTDGAITLYVKVGK